MLTLKQRQEIADIALALKNETNFITIINAIDDFAIKTNACTNPDKIKNEPGIRCLMMRAAQLLAFYQDPTAQVETINTSLGYHECNAIKALNSDAITKLREMAKTNKIGAIKELRVMTGTSLIWAKTIIDDIEGL